MRYCIFSVALAVMTSWTGLQAAGAQATTSAPAVNAILLNDACPGLASGGLIYARLTDLPQGTLLRAGELVISDKDIAEAIAKAPEQVRDRLNKNAFFILEDMATGKLILAEAKADASKAATAPAALDDRGLIQAYLGKLVEKAKVSEEEVAEFYKQNRAVIKAELGQVKPQIEQLLRRQKQQDLVGQHVKALGQRTKIEVSAAWAKQQAVQAKDNPVDKVRASGKPSLVEFTSKDCPPCKELAPTMEALKKKHEGKVNVLDVSMDEEQILSIRYGVDATPSLIFFDKDGKETFRHAGLLPQEEIEKQLARLGVK